MAVAVGTWSFSKKALEVIAEEFITGNDYMDALEKGVNAVENDPETGPYLVGRGGYPNAAGVLECDAAVMLGDRHQFGSVASIQGVAMPFSVARLVLEKSPHSMITGNGAKDFAEKHGITIENQKTLQTSKSLDTYQKYKVKQTCVLSNVCCDTLGVIVLDSTGHVAAGVSSSGMPFKSPGRVGDSPLPGSGLYADNEGSSPQQACDVVVRESQRKANTIDSPFEMALLALDNMVQGGMAITKRQWCGFVVDTKHLGREDLHIERIYFDPLYWNDFKKKLLGFCLYAVIPEILTQRVKRGKPLQPSLFEYKN